jgi:hypothetical protein
MKTDLKNCPSEADIETAFEKLNEHRCAVAIIEKPYNDKIKVIDDNIDEMISELMTDRAHLVKQSSNETEQHVEAIEILTEEIKEMVLENGKTCSTIFGTCTHVKGRKGAVKWDDAALMGFVSASPDNETILQFRSEKPDGKPSTRFTLVDIE